MRFEDRIGAGQKLAKELTRQKLKNPVVYALPRGGVVLGSEVAKALSAPLDLVITRKIGHPNNPEYAICAVAEDGELVCNQDELASIDKAWFSRAVKSEIAEAKRRRQTYLGRESISPKGKTAILVDDGIATGLTMQAAVKQLQGQGAKEVVVAIPIAPSDSAKDLEVMGTRVVALDIPQYYAGAVGAYYEDFPQVSDQEVVQLLKRSYLGQ